MGASVAARSADLSSLRRGVEVHDLDHGHGRRRAEPAHDFVALLDDRTDLEIEIRGQWRHRVSLHDAGMYVTRLALARDEACNDHESSRPA